MKQIFTFLILLVAITATSFAQNNITVKIHHKLGNDAFNLNQASVNNLGDDFNISRLQYYISEIAIIHDQGTETYVWDLYVLADASGVTNIDLGEHAITEVEGISFAIGVDQHNNHGDPALYDVEHPLGPKSPSMHWGWTSGYRFAVLEGKGGVDYNQTIELHGLGDNNYFRQTVDYSATAQDNEIVVHIDADYTKALEDIAVAGGVVNHGFINQALQLIENFRDYVFSPTTEIVSTTDFEEINSFDVFPNPSRNNTSYFKINASDNALYQVIISDVLGKELEILENVESNTNTEINLEDTGLYFISLIKEGQLITTEKLIIN